MPASPSRMRSAFRPTAPRPISPTPAKASFIASPIDPATGLPTGDPAPLFDHRGGVGGLDGAVVDAEGLIWNARWGGSCIDAYSPEGERVRTIRVPAQAAELPGVCRRRISTGCWSPRPGRAWTSRPRRPIRTMAKPSFSTSAHGAAGTSHQARPAMTTSLAPSRMRSS